MIQFRLASIKMNNDITMIFETKNLKHYTFCFETPTFHDLKGEVAVI